MYLFQCFIIYYPKKIRTYLINKPLYLTKVNNSDYFEITASATFIPSMAADIIPPAYPAPSPHG